MKIKYHNTAHLVKIRKLISAILMFSVLIAYVQKPPINALADVSSGARSLNIGLSLHLYPNYVYMSRKALVSLQICTDSPEPVLLNNEIRGRDQK